MKTYTPTPEEKEHGLKAGMLFEDEKHQVFPTNYGKYCALVDKIREEIEHDFSRGIFPDRDRMRQYIRLTLDMYKFINLAAGDIYAKR